MITGRPCPGRGDSLRSVTLPRPPYDPELGAFLEAQDAASPEPAAALSSSTLAGVREMLATFSPSIDTVIAGSGLEHAELSVPESPDRPGITLSVIRRPGVTTPTPCIYYVHGGGMIMGDRHTGAPVFSRWADVFGVTVVSVDYRLAPEHPYPAPVSDCYAGLQWVAAHADALGIDPARIIIAGNSAGGGLAAATTLMARDNGGPALIGALLSAPMLDDRDATLSTRQFDGPGPWNRSDNRFGWTALLGAARGTADLSPYAAPARAADLSGLPPVYLDVGSAEVFRDEIADYASRIWAAGGQAELHIWAGGFHGFQLAGETRVSQAALAARDSWLARLLAG
jgi:acetyl esterase/lipase